MTLSICAAESYKCGLRLVAVRALCVRPSPLSTETASLTSQFAVSRHHAHAQKVRVELAVSSRSLQLGLVLVDTMLVAGVSQARTVAAVGAVDEVLFVPNPVSEMNEMAFYQEAVELHARSPAAGRSLRMESQC